MSSAEVLPEPETTAELVAAWQLWQRARGLSERTITERAMVIARLPNPASISAVEIDRFLLHRGWSKATRATYHKAIRAWCRWLILTGRRADDPTLMAPPPKVPRNQPRPLADVHLTKLLRSVNRLRTRAMILLAAYAGLRVSEIAAIRGEDLDMLDHTITVIGKGDKRRTIPLHPVLVDLARSMPEQGWWFPTYTGNHQGTNGTCSATASPAPSPRHCRLRVSPAHPTLCGTGSPPPCAPQASTLSSSKSSWATTP
jgi:integrase